jgi:hypothetical protein
VRWLLTAGGIIAIHVGTRRPAASTRLGRVRAEGFPP